MSELNSVVYFQLSEASKNIPRPVVLLNGPDAKKLMNIVKK